MDNLAAADFGQFKISVVVTRENVTQLDQFSDIAESYGAQLRLTRFRPSGRGVETWDRLHPTAEQQRMLYHWLLERPDVLTGDSFFHLSALGAAARRAEPVRRRTGGLPDRPGRRRLCLPLRDRRGVPGRQRAPRRRLRRGVAAVRPLPVVARAAERGRLRLLRLLRRLPGRLHGGQVLHRPAARRSRPRVRVRPRRGGPGGPGRGGAPRRRRRPLQGGPPRDPDPGSHPRPLPDRARSHSDGPDVVDGAARRRHLARGRGDRAGHAAGGPARVARTARPPSPSRHGHPDRRASWPPGSPGPAPMWWWRPPWPTGPAASTPRSRARCSSTTTCWPTSWSSWSVPPGTPSPVSS